MLEVKDLVRRNQAEQNSESAKRGAEAFFRNFSANPNDIKNMFESAKDGLKEGVKNEEIYFDNLFLFVNRM